MVAGLVCRYADLGVSNMRAAIKGNRSIDQVARHLSASRASFEWSMGLLEEDADTESLAGMLT